MSARKTAFAAMVALAIAGTVPSWAAPRAAKRHPAPSPSPRHELPTREIAISINGDVLPEEPAPRVVEGRLLVPVVRIYSALGIGVTRGDGDVIATAPTKRIVIHTGSANATVNGRTIAMGGAAVELDGATYVPIRFVSESIGAIVSYDARAARVDIVSPLVGRVPQLQHTGEGGTITLTGNIANVDVNSQPASVTIVRGPSVRTISINSDAKVLVQDTVSRTNTTGSLGDLRVGDSISVSMRRNGSVAQIVVFFASRNGTAAAVTPSAVVLGDGRVITPDKSTEITLGGEAAKLSDLKVGDSITVRSNPETGEKRQIIATRASTAPPAPLPSAGVRIDSFSTNAKGPLRAGESLELTMKGTPGGRASYDIGIYITDLPLRESTPGTYTGRYTIPNGVNFAQTSIYGHLTVGGVSAPRTQAQTLVSVSTTPPQITEVAPREGLVVNNNRPSIYATYDSPSDVGINASSVQIRVNNLDVTASATRTPTFITYSPSVALGDGPVEVQVKVSDNAGNTATRRWAFTIKTR